MTPYEQAQKYIAAIPGAVSGSNGHAQTFSVACALLHGFCLSRSDAEQLIREYNHRCQPPWKEHELAHKLDSVATASHGKTRGHLLSAKQRSMPQTSRPVNNGQSSDKSKPKKKIDLTKHYAGAGDLPEAIPDGARVLIRELFRPGEGVRIAEAIMEEKEDGTSKEIPNGGGLSLSREEWLRKLDAVNGNPNAIWSVNSRKKKQPGIYIAINPYKVGATKDADVTDYRLTLVEFDEKLSPEEQFKLYTESRLPCAAITFSGGRSVHALVKINAEDKQEFDERVRIVHDYFTSAGLPIDPKNKNVGRFSRLPNCQRFDSRQDLLALNTGCATFTEWLSHIGDDELPQADTFDSLFNIDTSADPDCVVGFDRDGKTTRYLCKGKAAWIIGASGIGKSVLLTDFAVNWALGKPAFGMIPRKPLRCLVIQSENDRCDLAEMIQGIAKGHDIDPFDTPKEFAQLSENIIFITETRLSGEAFAARLHKLIEKHKPDIVWIDPMLAYIGIGVDVGQQVAMTQFLRQTLGPVLESTGVVLIGLHHTGKPLSARQTAGWTAIEYAYAGIGSSELVNWARAVMYMKPVDDITFELKLAKRGGRARATNPDGTFTKSIWLRQATEGIRWHQIDPPAPAEESSDRPAREPKPTKPELVNRAVDIAFFNTIPKEGEGLRALLKRLSEWMVSDEVRSKIVVSKGTGERAVELMLTANKIKCVGGIYYKGENA